MSIYPTTQMIKSADGAVVITGRMIARAYLAERTEVSPLENWSAYLADQFDASPIDHDQVSFPTDEASLCFILRYGTGSDFAST